MIYLWHFVLCFLFVTACGPKKVAVKMTDSYIESQVEKRLPLYQAQEEALAKDIDKFLNDHKDKVREIRPLLTNINLDDPAKLEEQYEKIVDAYVVIARNFTRVLARYMSDFDEKQKKDFFKRIEKENEEIADRNRKDRRQKIEARVRKFLGTLSTEQKSLLKAHASSFDAQVDRRLKRRKELHQKFQKILNEDLSPESKEKRLYEEFVEFQDGALASRENLEVAKKFLPTLSEEQKKHLRIQLKDIDEYVEYFLETNY